MTDDTLQFYQFGGTGGAPVLIAHGLYGSARNWRAIAKRLSGDRPAVTVDMRNHGESFHHDDMSYAAMADDLARVMQTETGPAHLIGHSMGGKAAMIAALRQPDLVRSLLVGDIAPVAYDHAGENVGYAKNMMAVDLARVQSRSDADVLLAETTADPSLRAFFLQSLDLSEGTPRWKFNLDVLMRAMPDIVGFPDVGGSYDRKVLFLSGAGSDYMDGQGKEKARALFPRARFASIKGAGHWLHADAPRAFIASVQAFIAAQEA